MAVSVDGIARNHALVAKLDLPFPVLADERASAIDAWGVYDPKAKIALPSLFLITPDLRVPYRYIGDDYADRPLLEELFAALDREAVTATAPRRLERTAPPGPRDPADSGKRPIPLEELPPYLRGASYAVTVLASRSADEDLKREAQQYRELVTGFLRAATATLEAKRR